MSSNQTSRLRPQTDQDFVNEIKRAADELITDGVSRGELKLLTTAFKELKYCFKVFKKYRGIRKVTVFGSARTKPDHPTYIQALDFGKKMSDKGYMIITGAGGGIMEAGHIGAGREKSLGLNIMLPFEQSANPVMTGNERLMTMRYFFTRKLMFVKETDAVILFPGGYGTHDEGFEVLTLIQTGKSHLFPVILVDQPGGTYWKRWHEFIQEELKVNGLISKPDTSLYTMTESVDDAVAQVEQFYRIYHSMRYVRKDLMIRLNKPISDDLLARLNAEFKDIIWEGTIVRSEPDEQEASDPHTLHLPRIRFRFDRHGHARFREMIDLINRETP